MKHAIRTLFMALVLAMANIFQEPAARLRDLPRRLRRALRWHLVVRPNIRPIAGGAYTDLAGKIIRQAFGTCQVTIGATVVPGDLLSPDATADTWVLADENAPAVAALVAVTGGVSGDTITAAMAVIAAAPPTGNNPPATQTLAASTDVCSPLYLSATAGKVSLSVGGTTAQHVGWVLSTTEILIIPGVSLSGTNLTLSGALSVGTTLAVAGASTLTGAVTGVDATDSTSTTTGAVKTAGGLGVVKALWVGGLANIAGVATHQAESVHSGGINIATLKTLRMPATDYATDLAITPKGMATISKATAAADTLAAGTAGDILAIFSKTAAAHVVTAGAGITFNGTNNTATFGGAINDGMLLLCISATLWVVLSKTNVTFSSV